MRRRARRAFVSGLRGDDLHAALVRGAACRRMLGDVDRIAPPNRLRAVPSGRINIVNEGSGQGGVVFCDLPAIPVRSANSSSPKWPLSQHCATRRPARATLYI
jgi:hypothetical protein